MGGGGGGDYRVPTGSGKPELSAEEICMSMSFTTELQPVPRGSIHQKGDVLPVLPTAAGTGTAFVVVDDSGEVVGTIIERTADLQRCTDLGVSFEAEVQEVFLDTHTVLVRAAL